MSDHTPGPWRYDRENALIVSPIDRDLFRVYHNAGRSFGETEANAHLIAAAPEMLGDLKACISILRGLGEMQAADLIAKTVVKAEGGAA